MPVIRHGLRYGLGSGSFPPDPEFDYTIEIAPTAMPFPYRWTMVATIRDIITGDVVGGVPVEMRFVNGTYPNGDTVRTPFTSAGGIVDGSISFDEAVGAEVIVTTIPDGASETYVIPPTVAEADYLIQVDSAPTTGETNEAVQIVYRVLDAASMDPVAGVTLAAASGYPTASGGGSFSGNTNASGFVTYNWTLGPGEGTHQMQAVATLTGQTSEVTSVTVTDPDPDPPGDPTTVVTSSRNWSGNTGTLRTFGIIPLPIGKVFPTELDDIQVLSGSPLVEQAVSVQALEGRYPDGSVMALHIQFDYDYASADDTVEIPGEIRFGNPRNTTDISPVAHSTVLGFQYAASAPNPPARLTSEQWDNNFRLGIADATFLPTDPDYLLSTNILNVEHVVKRSDVDAHGGLAKQVQDLVDMWGETAWARFLAITPTNFPTPSHIQIMFQEAIGFYGRSRLYYLEWLRSGDAEYYRRSVVYNFVRTAMYERHFGWDPSGIQRAQPELNAIQYYATGDPAFRAAVSSAAALYLISNANQTGWADRFAIWTPNQTGQTRGMGRQLQVTMWGQRLGLTTHPFATRQTDFLNRMVKRGAYATNDNMARGIVNARSYGFGGTPPLDTWLFNRPGATDCNPVNAAEVFQHPITLNEIPNLLAWFVPADPDLQGIFLSTVDWILDTMTCLNTVSKPVLRYCNVAVGSCSTGNSAGSHCNTITLNGMFLRMLATAYRWTSDPTYLDRLEDHVLTLFGTPNNGTSGPYLKTDVPPNIDAVPEKSWDEAFAQTADVYDALMVID